MKIEIEDFMAQFLDNDNLVEESGQFLFSIHRLLEKHQDIDERAVLIALHMATEKDVVSSRLADHTKLIQDIGSRRDISLRAVQELIEAYPFDLPAMMIAITGNKTPVSSMGFDSEAPSTESRDDSSSGESTHLDQRRTLESATVDSDTEKAVKNGADKGRRETRDDLSPEYWKDVREAFRERIDATRDEDDCFGECEVCSIM